MNLLPLPSHIAFIMDGNGRWATSQGKPRTAGHHEGAERFKDIVYACADMGVRYVSFYAFSKENWSRPDEEVQTIMGLWSLYMHGEIPRLKAAGVRIRVVGDRGDLNAKVLTEIEETEAATAECSRMTAFVMISYGARWEIVQAARILAQRARDGQLEPAQIDDATVASVMVTGGAPDPDLMIRTSGETRISNFMLWQLAYAEFMFVDEPWPDFRPANLKACIDAYRARERRFGGIGSTTAYTGTLKHSATP